MSRFTEKASSRIDRMSDEQIVRLIENQSRDLKFRDIVLDNTTSGFILAEKSGKILYYNKYLLNFMDVSSNKSSVNFFVLDNDLKKFIKDCLSKHSNEEDLFYNHRNTSMGDMYVRVVSIAIPQTDNVMFLFRDYTLIKKMMDEYKKNESLASMTTMAAGVAHEIKNPLASISIYLQLMNRKLEKEGSITKAEAEKSLNVISQEIERLNKMAVDFLYAVKPMSVNTKLGDLNSVVRKTIDVCKAEIREQGVELKVNLATSLPNTFIDSTLIQQCILNLIRNALQAFTDSSDIKEIQVSTYIDSDSVKLDVSDTGCGMSEETIQRIFEPYYTTKASGTGLGLTNIFKILREHNGRISVKSELGKGSVFTMELPVPNSERFRIE